MCTERGCLQVVQCAPCPPGSAPRVPRRRAGARAGGLAALAPLEPACACPCACVSECECECECVCWRVGAGAALRVAAGAAAGFAVRGAPVLIPPHPLPLEQGIGIKFRGRLGIRCAPGTWVSMHDDTA